MVGIQFTLSNFYQKSTLLSILGGYGNEFEYTADGIFRRVVPPPCPLCGTEGNHNGYNTYTKEGLGSVKMGRYRCPLCDVNWEEERDFWECLKQEFFHVLDAIYQRLRYLQVSYQGISSVMDLIFPRGKDTISNAFNSSVERAEIPPVGDVRIVHYDEQHPKEGRAQKFRLTLLDHATGRPIADEPHDRKDRETIRRFLEKNLDPSIPTFVVTDLSRGYPEIFKSFFGRNLVLQFCLTHLNRLIVRDFPGNTTMGQELIKYRLLDVFYNRSREIEFLEKLAAEERSVKEQGWKEHRAWLGEHRAAFRAFLHDLELKRRREHRDLEQRSYVEALGNFEELMESYQDQDRRVRKRLDMMAENWGYLTAFYFVPGAPATNNLLENYYSTSLKTHRKKQLRRDRGMENQLKLSAMKRAGMLDRPGETLLDAFLQFTPFLDAG
jgi:hypothetical protein